MTDTGKIFVNLAMSRNRLLFGRLHPQRYH
jgi:hypothetical protein